MLESVCRTNDTFFLFASRARYIAECFVARSACLHPEFPQLLISVFFFQMFEEKHRIVQRLI